MFRVITPSSVGPLLFGTRSMKMCIGLDGVSGTMWPFNPTHNPDLLAQAAAVVLSLEQEDLIDLHNCARTANWLRCRAHIVVAHLTTDVVHHLQPVPAVIDACVLAVANEARSYHAEISMMIICSGSLLFSQDMPFLADWLIPHVQHL